MDLNTIKIHVLLIVITWNNLTATSEHFYSIFSFKSFIDVLGMTLNCMYIFIVTVW